MLSLDVNDRQPNYELFMMVQLEMVANQYILKAGPDYIPTSVRKICNFTGNRDYINKK